MQQASFIYRAKILAVRRSDNFLALSIEGKQNTLDLTFRISTVHTKIYFQKNSVVYLNFRKYRNTAIYGSTTVCFEYGADQHASGYLLTNSFGLVTHPTLTEDRLGEEFEKLYLIRKNIGKTFNPALLQYGRPTTIGIMCETEMDYTMSLLAL